MGTGDILLGGYPAMDLHPIQRGGGGVAILSVPSCYRNRDKLQPCGPPWLVCNFTYLYHTGGGKLWSCLLHATDTEVKMPTLRSHLVSSGYWIGQRT